MRLTRRRWLAAGALFAVLALGSFALAQAIRYSHEPTKITVEATPIAAFDPRDESKVRFGQLEFRGGLVLTSKYPAFGGLSALHMQPDGAHFIAVSDNGSWLRARIVYKDGRPAGIADAEMAPALGPDGTPLADRGWFDMESLAERDGQFYVGIERVEQIVHFDLNKFGFAARGEPIKVPGDFKTFKYNKSLECLAAPPQDGPLAGDLIAVTERSLDAHGNHRAFLFEGDHVARFSVKRSDDFDVSDCAILPSHDLLLLERSYSLAKGVAMRMRRIPLVALKEGALVDGPVLVTADMGYQIDNMEAIDVWRRADGALMVSLMSDDNHSILQRNLYLEFLLREE